MGKNWLMMVTSHVDFKAVHFHLNLMERAEDYINSPIIHLLLLKKAKICQSLQRSLIWKALTRQRPPMTCLIAILLCYTDRWVIFSKLPGCCFRGWWSETQMVSIAQNMHWRACISSFLSLPSFPLEMLNNLCGTELLIMLEEREKT